jgi:curved DNA-binding protein CbpA
VASKTHYQLLELPPSATADEIKKSFRQLIARYHPDKVQHLGKEFQDMAAERAAELTEAYRILSDEGRRAEYDRVLSAGGPGAAGAGAAAASAAASRPADTGGYTPPPPPPSPSDSGSSTQAFSQERATRDSFIRKALLGRLRQAAEMMGGYDESQEPGFDLVWLPKSKMFARSKGPRLVARFVSQVDAGAVAETWVRAAKWAGAEEVCVILIGSAVASAGELAIAIAEQRRKSRSAKVTLIPVDGRNWDAHLPTDAPESAKTLLTRVRSGA